MGTWANLLKNKYPKTSETVGSIETVFEVAGSIMPYYNTAVSLLEFVGLIGKPGQPDIISVIANLLDQYFAALEQELLAASKITLRGEVAKEVAKCTTAIQFAYAYKEAPEDRKSQEDFANARHDAAYVVELLRDGNFGWWRVYTENAIYSDLWNGNLKPSEYSDIVWDYRLALPAYLEALIAQVVVLEAAGKDYLTEERLQAIDAHADRLIEYHDKILNEFVMMRCPHIGELLFFLTCFDLLPGEGFRLNKGGPWIPKTLEPILYSRDYIYQQLYHNYKTNLETKWFRSGYILGAVEKWSGYFIVLSFPTSEIINGFNFLTVMDYDLTRDNSLDGFYVLDQISQSFQNFYKKFQIRHTLRSWRYLKQLYCELGLPEVRKTVKHLKRFVGKEKFEFPDYTSWSVREVNSMIREVMRANVAPTEPISLRRLANFNTDGESPSELSLKEMFLINETLQDATPFLENPY